MWRSAFSEAISVAWIASVNERPLRNSWKKSHWLSMTSKLASLPAVAACQEELNAEHLWTNQMPSYSKWAAWHLLGKPGTQEASYLMPCSASGGPPAAICAHQVGQRKRRKNAETACQIWSSPCTWVKIGAAPSAVDNRHPGKVAHKPTCTTMLEPRLAAEKKNTQVATQNCPAHYRLRFSKAILKRRHFEIATGILKPRVRLSWTLSTWGPAGA